ncbi:DUF5916 domain-containing protein [Mucilaginibacter ginsenosidivorans]|uniref:DUF5916 domain-containing protein n=1 Tax=Mucilaginibacter ginsenosidivorans TaxID=398053 RepID=UPI0016524883|nr:DUF5916 domain-containing protein [Mucilaginibacter ginsenosidivorans]
MVIQSLKRDVNPYYSEGFSIVLDPSNQKSSGFTFGVNASGAQFDGIVQLNSDSFEMDAKWYSATKRYDGYWTAEMAIPFKSLRFPANATQWGVNFIRNDMTNNSFSTWNRVPVAYFGANLGFLGKGIFEAPPAKPGSNNAILPYINTGISNNGNKTITKPNAGLDAKLALTSSLNLDLTFNPDFSQVDVDQQVINLTRYDISFPEKRSFFLENGDLYSTLGSPILRPIFSRKIGLTENGQGISLIGGTRLNGYLDSKTRIEVMDVQSGRQQNNLYQNYFAAIVQREILQHSNVRAFFTNVQSTGGKQARASDTGRFNRVFGTEFNYVAPGSNYDFGAKFSGSLSPTHLGDNLYNTLYVDYFSPKVAATVVFNSVGKNYITLTGFTPRINNFDAARDSTLRLGYYENTNIVTYSIYPKNKKVINTHVLTFNSSVFLNENGSMNETDLNMQYAILFANRRTASITWAHQDIHLPFETGILAGLDNFKPGHYSFGYYTFDYESNFLRPFSWSASAQAGSYFSGSRVSFTGGVKQRIQPWAYLGLSFNYNYVKVAGNSVKPFIAAPTFEFDLNNNMYLTTFVQYNSSLRNVNVNSRFQWRFKPLSDIFLVYAANYASVPTPGTNNYKLTLKVDYWIN